MKTPGVYVQEVPTLPPSVAEVATAIPAFIGHTETGKAGAVEVAIVAVVAQHAVKPAVAAVSIVLAPIGYWFSYRRRMRPSIVVKILLAIGLMDCDAALDP